MRRWCCLSPFTPLSDMEEQPPLAVKRPVNPKDQRHLKIKIEAEKESAEGTVKATRSRFGFVVLECGLLIFVGSVAEFCPSMINSFVRVLVTAVFLPLGTVVIVFVFNLNGFASFFFNFNCFDELV